MMDLKQAYGQSNRHKSTFQNLRTNPRKEECQYWELNSNTANLLCYDDMPLIKVSIKGMMNIPWPEIETLDDLAEWCAMPKGELPNHIAWCFMRFANVTDYVNLDQYFSCLNDEKYIQPIEITLWVTSFRCEA